MRGSLLAAGAVAVLVAGCVAVAWIERAPIVPANAGRAGGGTLGLVFLGLLAAAFAAYLGGLWLATTAAAHPARPSSLPRS